MSSVTRGTTVAFRVSRFLNWGCILLIKKWVQMMIAELGRAIRELSDRVILLTFEKTQWTLQRAAFIYWLMCSIFALDRNVNVSATEI